MVFHPTQTRQYVLAKRPTGTVDPSQTFKLVTTDLPKLASDQVLVKILYLSNDPAQRGWIDANIDPERLYVPPVQINEVMRASRAIAEVLDSHSETLKAGQIVACPSGWTEYAVLNAKECMPCQPLGDLSPTQYLGAFGGTGLTAFYGLEVVRAGPEDTLVVSGAAGATGSMVVQIAKHLLGCKKVIGIAGSDEKCRWVESLGADKCVDYKSASFEEDLKAATDGYVEVYFDNVGGKVLDLMLGRLKRHGRVAACGAIATYNSRKDPDHAINNWQEIIMNRLEIRGFIVLDAMSRAQEIIGKLVQGAMQGKIKVSDKNETVVPTKFEDIPQTWLQLYSGGNTGKLVTKIEY